MSRQLTKKQRKFVNEYADTGNGTQSVIAAAYNVKDNDVAAVIAVENLGKPKIQEELKKLGFDSNNAKRVISEILNDETIEPQHRIKAAENVFKVHGDYSPEKHLNLNVEVGVREELKELANGLLQYQRQ